MRISRTGELIMGLLLIMGERVYYGIFIMGKIYIMGDYYREHLTKDEDQQDGRARRWSGSRSPVLKGAAR